MLHGIETCLLNVCGASFMLPGVANSLSNALRLLPFVSAQLGKGCLCVARQASRSTRQSRSDLRGAGENLRDISYSDAVGCR
jgi:UPF0716 family protein affecting phage T7 exclusion